MGAARDMAMGAPMVCPACVCLECARCRRGLACARPGIGRSRSPRVNNETNQTAEVQGLDPRQPLDTAYTRKIHDYTTEPFFLSPLVDYLPASATVPTPAAAIWGHRGLADGAAVHGRDQRLHAKLARTSPRVRVYSIGQSEKAER